MAGGQYYVHSRMVAAYPLLQSETGVSIRQIDVTENQIDTPLSDEVFGLGNVARFEHGKAAIAQELGRCSSDWLFVLDHENDKRRPTWQHFRGRKGHGKPLQGLVPYLKSSHYQFVKSPRAENAEASARYYVIAIQAWIW
jgi:peptidoglycan/xylan/chitin deacetylase (PgdA/CDA1 family)